MRTLRAASRRLAPCGCFSEDPALRPCSFCTVNRQPSPSAAVLVPAGSVSGRMTALAPDRCPGLPLATLAWPLPPHRASPRSPLPASSFRCRVTRRCTMLRMGAASPASIPAHRRSQHVRSSPALAMLASLTVTPFKIVTPLPTTAPNMDAPARVHPTLSGASLRDRAIRSNLRSLVLPAITAPIPRASAPFGRCALRLPGGTVLRTLALARVGEAVRSSAAAAPLRRVPRRRFPHPQCCAFRSSRPPGAALGLTPHASAMQTTIAATPACPGTIALCKQGVVPSAARPSFPFRTSDPRHVQDTTLLQTRRLSQPGTCRDAAPSIVTFARRRCRGMPSAWRGLS